MNTKPFIVGFEGIDGAGKTTQVRLLEEKLNSMGYSVRKITETEDIPLGRLASSMPYHPENWKRYITFLASKAELAETLANCSEDFVLLDRFIPSFFAYTLESVKKDPSLYYALRRLMKVGIRFPKVHVCVLMRSSYEDHLARRNGADGPLSEEEFRDINRRYRRATHGCALWKLEVNTSVTAVDKAHEVIVDYVLRKYRQLTNPGDESCPQ